jgi:hypothetical protein
MFALLQTHAQAVQVAEDTANLAGLNEDMRKLYMIRPLLPLTRPLAPNIEGHLLRPLLVQEHLSAFQAFENLNAAGQERYRYVHDADGSALEPLDVEGLRAVLNHPFASELRGRPVSMIIVWTTAVKAALRALMLVFHCDFLK